AHVADGGAVGQRNRGDARAVEFDELADDSVLTQHLGDGQYDVGRSGARLDVTGQFEADDLGDEHRHRLAQHRRFGLDAADAPAQYPQSVDHCGVRVGAHTGVRVGLAVPCHDRTGEVLDVDLVDDAGARRDHLELVEGTLAPTQELVPFLVAFVLDLHVAFECARVPERVDHHGVVDDHLGRRLRIHLLRVAAQVGDRFAHGGEVYHARYAGEVLHDHACRGELDLCIGFRTRVPAAERADVLGGDVGPVLGPQ